MNAKAEAFFRASSEAQRRRNIGYPDVNGNASVAEAVLVAKSRRRKQEKLEKQDRLRRMAKLANDRQRMSNRRRQIFERDGYRCVTCGRLDKELSDTEFLTVDHIVPRSRGGKNRMDNLQTMCSPYNTRKGDSTSHGASGEPAFAS